MNVQPKQSRWFNIICVAAVAIGLVEAVMLLYYREVWIDEIFSTFKSYLVLKGTLIPFHNAIFEYPPLVIATYGLAAYLFGPSILVSRFLSFLFYVCMVSMLYSTVRKMAGKAAAIIALLFIFADVLLVGNFVSATMYAPMGFLSILLIFLETTHISRRSKTVYAALIIGVAILGRTNLVALAISYIIFLLIILGWAALQEIGVFLVGVIILIAVGYVPLFVHNPTLAFAHVFSPFANIGPLKSIPVSMKVGSQSISRFLEVFTAFIKEYGVYLTVFLSIASYTLYERKNNLLTYMREQPGWTLAFISSVILLCTHYFYFRIVSNVYYANYFMPFLILVMVTAGWTMGKQVPFFRFALTAALIVIVAANLYRTDIVSSPGAESDLARIDRGAAFVATHTTPDSKIVVFDNSLFHLYRADRRTYLPLINRDFLFMDDSNTDAIAPLGFYNMPMLKKWATDADYVMYQKEKWPSSLVRIQFWQTGNKTNMIDIADLQEIFDKQYVLVGEVENVYPRKYTEGNDGGTLLLFKHI